MSLYQDAVSSIARHVDATIAKLQADYADANNACLNDLHARLALPDTDPAHDIAALLSATISLEQGSVTILVRIHPTTHKVLTVAEQLGLIRNHTIGSLCLSYDWGPLDGDPDSLQISIDETPAIRAVKDAYTEYQRYRHKRDRLMKSL